MFQSALIANRGEIAVRLIRAFRELGVYTIAVYSQADQQALHVRLADQAVYIGEAPAVQSYLSHARVLQAALDSGAQAIHPGYGFLSENATFAQAVMDAGLVFIGPPPAAIQAMGDKASARARMIEAGVPVVPGYQGADDPQTLMQAASEIGLPLLIKAAAGGGGKGMRIAWHISDLNEALAAARNEALASFGDGRLILERYIPRAHHIEIQVLGDQHGNLLHLFERECSVQRRYQKIIEETPSPLLDIPTRQAMGAAAVAAARAVGYHNAGTVEFLFDSQSRQFYFLEMNTRLQVEHPITEMVTGLDLAQWQIKIAAGERLPFGQDELRQSGHAIECRLYAEDPANNFLPAAGRLLRWIEPKGPGVRVDSGFTSGDEISLHYDPLIAKIVVHAADRPSAIRKMQASLSETVALGLPTNWRFLQDVLAHPDFQEGLAHTAWVEECFDAWEAQRCELPPEALIAAALTQFETVTFNSGASPPTRGDPNDPWRSPQGFRLGKTGSG